jgi:hypothetical protein
MNGRFAPTAAVRSPDDVEQFHPLSGQRIETALRVISTRRLVVIVA